MSDRVWHKGPPPHIGWWQASYCKDKVPWRWWDGERWGGTAYASYSPLMAGSTAHRETPLSSIEWNDYWPENARVPRLDPTGGHWTFNVDGTVPAGLPENIELCFRNGQIRKWPFAREQPASDWKLRGTYYDILAWRPAA